MVRRIMRGCGVAAVVILVMTAYGCLPFPLGDPQTSRVDPKLNGYWLSEENGQSILLALYPFDQHAYVLEYHEFTKQGDLRQPKGRPMLFKAWLTEIKGKTFLTLDFLPSTINGDTQEKKAYPVVRLSRSGEQIQTQMVSADFASMKSVKSAEDVAAVITRELDNPDLYTGEKTTFRHLDAERDKPLIDSMLGQ